MKSAVFEFAVKNVVTIRVTGSNEGRYERYCRRLTKEGEAVCDHPVAYSSSVAGTWKIADGEASSELREFSGRPAFYETTYQVRCKFAPEAGVSEAYVLHEMKSVADEFDYDDNILAGRFDFVNTPGQFTFEVNYVSHGKLQKLVLKWWVVSEKIDVVGDVREIKETIEKENQGFVYYFLSQTKNKAGLSGLRNSGAGEWLDIFRNFVDPYRKAVNLIVHSPHLRYHPEEKFVRADKVRRWSPQLVNRLTSMDRDRQERALFRVEQIRPKIDTPENRFVLFTLKKISARLKLLENMCRNADGVADEYADKVGAWAKELDRLILHPFFKAIGPFSGLKQESLVLQRQRGYSKIFETWVALQHALDLTSDGLDAGNRPIWKLYEFWCYLVIRNYLRDVAKFSIDEEKSGLGSLLKVRDVFSEVDPESEAADEERTDKGLNKCQYVFNDAGGNRTVKLTYQQSYSNARSADGDDACLAHIVEQIPDIVMEITENDGERNVFTYLFDAKYQIMSWPSVKNAEKDAAPYKTINEMHRYRDAILYRRQKEAGATRGKLNHEVIGAYVLYPGRPEKAFEYGDFINEENIGAIPLLPGEDGVKVLHSYLEKFLAHTAKDEHLAQAIPPRGASIILTENEESYLREEIVYGTYHGADQLEWIEKKHIYNMAVDMAKDALGVETAEQASRKRVLVLLPPRRGGAASKMKVFRIRRLASGAPVSAGDLKAVHGYPRTPSSPEYWLWELEP